MAKSLASHQCGPGTISGVHAICGLSLLLVLVPEGRLSKVPVTYRARYMSLVINVRNRSQFLLALNTKMI